MVEARACACLSLFLYSAASAADPEAATRPSLPQAGIDLLTFHRTNYFISGFSEQTQVKFQFSFKYDLWPNRTGHAVYFAYTQKSLWDLWSFSRSSPFRESNYNPELVYTYRHAAAAATEPRCTLVAEQAGFDHESNGEAGSQSRS
ncbi:MAG TPA: phospholipase A, partial [Polyangiaceae bacterium]|nr:phospholipase A [Polyangiaceae bacterium]